MPTPDPARLLIDDRLSACWLRPSPGEPLWYAPVALPSGALALCRARVPLSYPNTARALSWTVYGSAGIVTEGEREVPAIASWQALAAVERALEEHGIRLAGGVRQERLPTE